MALSKTTKEKYDLFVATYLLCFNATRSAIEAGYSKKTAKQQGSRLLTNAYIKEKLEIELKRLRERMAEESSRAFARILGMLIDVDKKLRRHDEAQSNIESSGHSIYEISTRLIPYYDILEEVETKHAGVNGNKDRPLKHQLAGEIEELKDEIRLIEREKRPFKHKVDQEQMFIIYPRDWEKVMSLKANLLQDILDRGGFKPTDKIEHSGSVENKAVLPAIAGLTKEDLEALANIARDRPTNPTDNS